VKKVEYPKVCEECGDPFKTYGPRAKLCVKCRRNRYKKPGPLKEEERLEMRQASSPNPVAQLAAAPYNRGER